VTSFDYNLEIWYVGCVLPSSATNPSNTELNAIIGDFSQNFGKLAGSAVGEFEPDAGGKVEVITAQAGKASIMAMAFADQVSRAVRGHGAQPDQLYVNYSIQPGAPKPRDNKVFPLDADYYAIGADQHLLFTGEIGKEPIAHGMNQHDGLIFWERDRGGGDNDDLLFNLDCSMAYLTNTAESTNVAEDDAGTPIVGAEGLQIEGACDCPPGLYGRMFNDDYVFNAKQDCFYRLIWTLLPN